MTKHQKNIYTTKIIKNLNLKVILSLFCIFIMITNIINDMKNTQFIHIYLQ
jgi:hypothetical protein